MSSYLSDVILGTTYTVVDGTAATTNRSFTYNHLGQQTLLVDDAGTRCFGYNSYGERETDSLVVDGDTHLITEQRDSFGRSIGYVYSKNGSAQQTITTGFGDDGRIASVGFLHGGMAKNFGYTYLAGSNLLQVLTKPNGMTLTQTYETTRNLLTDTAYNRGTTLVAQRTYTYDISRRPTARNTARQGAVVNDTFVHNKRSELVEAHVDNKTYGYTFDNIGNRQSSTEDNTVVLYDTNEINQYASVSENGATTFESQFDTDGNQTIIKTDTGIWATVYNVENRPISFTNEATGTVVECAYDSMGRRAYKKVTFNGNVTLHQRYLYRGYQQIACIDLTRSHHPALWFITWDPSQTVATRPLAIQINGTWYTYGWDLTKNICELYSTSGFISDSYTYTPFGSVTSTNGITQPILWSSEIFDPELGLVCYNYRYYNPSSGKWINRDLLQEYVSLNRYLLVNNSPIHNCDYLGLSEIPNCNQQNRGEKHYFCSKLGISNASSNFRFNNLIDNLQDLLKDIEWLENGLDVGSFATARSAKDIIDAVAEMIITQAAENGADDEWILQKLQEIANYYKNISGASIDVEITVSQCKCRDTWELILSLGIMDRYYWDEIDKKIYSFVVSRTNGIQERKDRAGYIMAPEFRTPV